MKINFPQLYEGWKNNLFPSKDVKDWIKEVGKERMSICRDCDLISTKHKTKRPDVHCTNCGCTLAAKTKCLSCACPLVKWAAVMATREEEEAFKKEIYEK